MLENLGKPVIVTGSQVNWFIITSKKVYLHVRCIWQIPCFETRSDGRDNIVGALILAGNYNIPEVCVYFRQGDFKHNVCFQSLFVKISASYGILYSYFCLFLLSVMFRHELLRGNRTVKTSTNRLNAFQSPNMNPLVKVGKDQNISAIIK